MAAATRVRAASLKSSTKLGQGEGRDRRKRVHPRVGSGHPAIGGHALDDHDVGRLLFQEAEVGQGRIQVVATIGETAVGVVGAGTGEVEGRLGQAAKPGRASGRTHVALGARSRSCSQAHQPISTHAAIPETDRLGIGLEALSIARICFADEVIGQP